MRAIALMALVLTLIVSRTSAAEEAPPLRLVRSIPLDGVKGRIDHMAVDIAGKRLFIAALGNNSVEVIDLEGGKRIASLTGMREPQGVCFLPGSNKLVVTSGGDGRCLIYDAALKLVGTVDGLDDADNVRYDAETKLVYVGYGDGALAVIDPARVVKVADIKLASHPESFQLESHGRASSSMSRKPDRLPWSIA